MKADIILVIKDGHVVRRYLVEDSVTAEATFDSIVEDLLDEEDLEEVYRYFDYGRRLTEANNLLKVDNIEIEWFVQVKINKFKN